jgi:hypothetical protein
MSTPCVTNVTGNLRARSHHKYSPEKRGPCIRAVAKTRNRPQNNSEQQHTPSSALSVATLHDSRDKEVNGQTILHQTKTYTYLVEENDDNRSYYSTGL